jgi:CRISPR/Cas system-associated exonuclease Cas4 (RecB family)
MSFRDRPYRPSPSCIGSCKRSLVYWALDYPQGEDIYTEFRAARGTAIHKAFPELLEIIWRKLLVDGKRIIRCQIMGHEVPIKLRCGSVNIQGTADLLLEVEYEDGTVLLEVWDLKNYSRVPDKPYENNVLQLRLYAAGLGCDRGVLLYCPDQGMPQAFVVEPDNAGIRHEAEQFFLEVAEAIESRDFPPREAYNSQHCSYCSYWKECWGNLYSEIKEIEKFEKADKRREADDGLIKTIIRRKQVLKDLTKLKDESDTLQDSLMAAFDTLKTTQIVAGDDVLTLTKVNRKDGGSYYKILEKSKEI